MRRRRSASRPRDDAAGGGVAGVSPPLLAEKEENPNKIKANFSLSSALAADVQTGNSRQGVVLKFLEHLEARVPNIRWRLYVFRKKDASSSSATAADDGGLIDTHHISRQTSYMLGREREVAADVPINHPPLSKQHAVLQYRALPLWEESGRILCSHWTQHGGQIPPLSPTVGALQISWFIFGDKFQGSALDNA